MYDELFHQAGATSSMNPLTDECFKLRTPATAKAPARHIYNQYCVRVPANDRDDLREHLKANDIGTEVYYPVPLHMQECFAELGCKEGELPNTESAALETIALPIYPELTEDQIRYVATTIIEFMNNRS
jgi:dTDP-4-amino-4,6-dideoxygalactose transaminase